MTQELYYHSEIIVANTAYVIEDQTNWAVKWTPSFGWHCLKLCHSSQSTSHIHNVILHNQHNTFTMSFFTINITQSQCHSSQAIDFYSLLKFHCIKRFRSIGIYKCVNGAFSGDGNHSESSMWTAWYYLSWREYRKFKFKCKEGVVHIVVQVVVNSMKCIYWWRKLVCYAVAVW